MILKFLSFAVLFILPPILHSQTQTLSDQSRVGIRGIGSVLVGMTVPEAERAAGKRFIQDQSAAEEYGCYYYHAQGGPSGVAFMVTKGTVARVDIFNNVRVKTISGIGVGDSESIIQRTYKAYIEVRNHQYVPGGHYLIFVPKDKADSGFRIVFETNERGIVTSYRAGRIPEVEMVEGCL